jgi:hypothetical protein
MKELSIVPAEFSDVKIDIMGPAGNLSAVLFCEKEGVPPERKLVRRQRMQAVNGGELLGDRIRRGGLLGRRCRNPGQHLVARGRPKALKYASPSAPTSCRASHIARSASARRAGVHSSSNSSTRSMFIVALSMAALAAVRGQSEPTYDLFAWRRLSAPSTGVRLNATTLPPFAPTPSCHGEC